MNWVILYNRVEVAVCRIKGIRLSPNGVVPKAKDFVNPKRLTKEERRSLEAFRKAMQALKEEEAKYGKKAYI
jgi:hypothetical protein